MLVPVSAAYRPRRKPARPSGLIPPPAANLSLLAADFDPAGFLTLTFDRPVSINALSGAQIQVEDGPITATIYNGGGGAVLVEPAMVRITLVAMGAYAGTQTLLLASTHTRIAAVNDGGTWPGTAGLNLPFPWLPPFDPNSYLRSSVFICGDNAFLIRGTGSRGDYGFLLSFGKTKYGVMFDTVAGPMPLMFLRSCVPEKAGNPG